MKKVKVKLNIYFSFKRNHSTEKRNIKKYRVKYRKENKNGSNPIKRPPKKR